MAQLSLRPELKSLQTLRMLPAMQQAIQLLQLNRLDMVQHIQEQMLENPALEAVPDSEGLAPEAPAELVQRAKEEQRDLEEQRNGDEGSTDWERLLQSTRERSPRQPGPAGTIYDELPPIEANLVYGESLADHLVFQLQMSRCSEEERKGAEVIIFNLDDRGYLAAPLEELATDAGLSLEVMQEALELVQELDPVGCAARDLSECLVLQARHYFPEDDTFERILRDHLRNLERRNYLAIARDLSLELEDVVEYHKMIQHELDPLPGRSFGGDDARYIAPDVRVERRDSGWVVLIDEEGMPELRISRYFSEILQHTTASEQDRMNRRLRRAHRISLQRRHSGWSVALEREPAPDPRLEEHLSRLLARIFEGAARQAEGGEGPGKASRLPPGALSRLLQARQLVLERGERGWQVTIDQDRAPDPDISEQLSEWLHPALITGKEYLLDKLKGAAFLIKSIHRRRQTIRKVMESILKFQDDFFEHGPACLRPLVLQDVADDIGMHTSTVSRVTRNKYVQTPHGLYELKSFFSQAVAQQAGHDLSARVIQGRIRQLIAGENPNKPLSDQKLETLLAQEGVRVARRTIAKYREAMGILPSSHRKKSF